MDNENSGQKKPVTFEFDEGIKNHKRFWFMVGFYRASCLGDKDDKSLGEFESLLKGSEIFEEYLDAVIFWKSKLNGKQENETKL